MRYANQAGVIQAQAMKCEPVSTTLTADASRLCDQLGEASMRLDKIGVTLFGSEPNELAGAGSAPEPECMRSDLDRAFRLTNRIFAELTRIEARL